MLIAIEGVDGVGKSSAISEISRLLDEASVEHSIKSEFPVDVGKHISDTLKRGLFLSNHLDMTAGAAFFYLLYLEQLAMSAVRAADVIIADRYLYTHALYQGYFASRKDPCDFDPMPFVRSLSDLYSEIGTPLPDLVIILDAPFDVIIERLTRRERRQISAADKAIVKLFQQHYRRLAQLSIFETAIIDSNRAPSDVARDVLELLFSRRRHAHVPRAPAT